MHGLRVRNPSRRGVGRRAGSRRVRPSLSVSNIGLDAGENKPGISREFRSDFSGSTRRGVVMIELGGKVPEWIGKGLFALFVLVVGYLMRSHGRRLECAEQEVSENAREVARLNQAQKSFQRQVDERLQRGDALFDKYEARIKDMQASQSALNGVVQRLEAISDTMENRVKTLDDRIYNKRRGDC